MTDKGLERLKLDEGLRLKPYICPAGKLTVGYGHVIQTHETSYLNKEITQEQADKLLIEDVRFAELGVRRYFPDFETFSPGRKDALINMVFNLGWGGFGKFKNFINYVNLERWEIAANSLKRSLWYSQVKNRAERIIQAIEEG